MKIFDSIIKFWNHRSMFEIIGFIYIWLDVAFHTSDGELTQLSPGDIFSIIWVGGGALVTLIAILYSRYKAHGI